MNTKQLSEKTADTMITILCEYLACLRGESAAMPMDARHKRIAAVRNALRELGHPDEDDEPLTPAATPENENMQDKTVPVLTLPDYVGDDRRVLYDMADDTYWGECGWTMLRFALVFSAKDGKPDTLPEMVETAVVMPYAMAQRNELVKLVGNLDAWCEIDWDQLGGNTTEEFIQRIRTELDTDRQLTLTQLQNIEEHRIRATDVRPDTPLPEKFMARLGFLPASFGEWVIPNTTIKLKPQATGYAYIETGDYGSQCFISHTRLKLGRLFDILEALLRTRPAN